MKKIVLGAAGVLAIATAAPVAAQAPTSSIYISSDEIAAVNEMSGVDRQLQVVDMGSYNLAVGVVHRGASRPQESAGDQMVSAPAPGPNTCGELTDIPASTARGIAHDATTETYYILSGTGTLTTGGHIVNGRRSSPESSVTTILNGPSCSGYVGGESVSRVVHPGDVIIIPAGVPHAWSDIADHVDYLSVRPDVEKVLPAGYVNPTIEEMRN